MQKHEKLHLLDFPLSLILLYPVRNSLPFTSLRSVTIGSGRDFLEGDTRRGQSRGLIGPVAPLPAVAEAGAHADVVTAVAEAQAVRGGVAAPWGST